MNSYGENFLVRFPAPWSRWVFLNEPDAIGELVEDVNPPKSPEFKRGIEAVARGGLLTADWEDWVVQRRLVQPSLSEKLVGSWHQIFEESCAPMLARLEHAADEYEDYDERSAFADRKGVSSSSSTHCLLHGAVRCS